MKLLGVFLLGLGPLFSQIEPGQKYEQDVEFFPGTYSVAYEFTYEVVVRNGVKTLLWNVDACDYPPFYVVLAGDDKGSCGSVAMENAFEPYSAVRAVIAAFYSQYPNGDDKYGPFSRPGSATAVHPNLATVARVAPPNPRMIFLDGLGNSIYAVDMTNFNTVSQVVVPSTAGPFGIRPRTSSNEVWVANGGNGISVVDLKSQSVLTTIATPSIPQGTLAVVDITFDAAGMTGFEAVQYYSPDSSGNNGALLVFNAVTRTMTTTLPWKNAPTAMVMAPDGSTLYILDSKGTLTYYDVLSGTADLAVSTFTPGMFGGITNGPIFIHPDGTRLFWNINTQFFVFDLTARKITIQFNSGLPSTSGVAMTMSQDGGRVYLSNGLGNVVIMDTKYGSILATETISDGSALVFGGPPVAP